MNVSANDLSQYFEQFGITYSKHSDDMWITGIRTPVSTFQIFVRLTDEWIFLFINPLVVVPDEAVDRSRFYYHALRFNHDMNMVKLGLDGDGDLFMIVELPTEGFQYSHFRDAINALSYHADALYLELLNLGHQPDASGRYDQEIAGVKTQDSDAEADDEDVIIGGRRLKIGKDEQGNPLVELDPPPDEDDDLP